MKKYYITYLDENFKNKHLIVREENNKFKVVKYYYDIGWVEAVEEWDNVIKRSYSIEDVVFAISTRYKKITEEELFLELL